MLKCDMLVDTTCDEQCDWQRLASEPYDFGALEPMAYDELFVPDVAVESPGDAVVVAKFVRYSQQSGGNAAVGSGDGWCSVPGCCLPFPAYPLGGWKKGITFKYKERTQVLWQANRLCNTHFKRLEKFRLQKDTIALEAFRQTICDSEVPCLALRATPGTFPRLFKT